MNSKTTTAYVAYFDLLGFKQVVQNLSTENLDELYSFLIRDTQHAFANEKEIIKIDILPVFNSSKIKGINISDSIIFFSDDDSESSLKAILETISKFVLYIESYTSYRGCLVLGSFNYVLSSVTNDSNKIVHIVSTLYGKALIDAYLKAEAQEWVGCFIDDSVVNHSSKNDFSKDNFSNYIEYDVPFKSGNKKLLALKKTLSDSNGKSYEFQVKEIFEYNGLKYSEEVSIKYQNTLEFRCFCNKLDNK